jgi:hypothetical protein
MLSYALFFTLSLTVLYIRDNLRREGPQRHDAGATLGGARALPAAPEDGVLGRSRGRFSAQGNNYEFRGVSKAKAGPGFEPARLARVRQPERNRPWPLWFSSETQKVIYLS